MPNLKPHTSAPRERLIETARQMFLAQGVPNVGINAVTEQAKIARMTLYNNFSSKDALVLAVFELESEQRRAAIMEAQSQREDSVAKILALFDVSRDLANMQEFRGCAFINLAIEAAAPDGAMHHIAKSHKEWVRENIMGHLTPDVHEGADILAQQILMLWDGASVEAYIQQSDGPIRAARDAASVLIQAATR